MHGMTAPLDPEHLRLAVYAAFPTTGRGIDDAIRPRPRRTYAA
jgi:hypothetical protein